MPVQLINFPTPDLFTIITLVLIPKLEKDLMQKAKVIRIPIRSPMQ